MASTVADTTPAAIRSDTRHLHWVSGRAALAREHWLTVLAAVLAIASAWPIVTASIRLALDEVKAGAYVSALASLAHIVLAAVLLYGTLVYLSARIGHLARLRAVTAEAPALPTPAHHQLDRASLVVLIPAYVEDAEVVRRALLSAALQGHANRRVVLLIDDPPMSVPAAVGEDVRALPREVADLLRLPRERYEAALVAFDARVSHGGVSLDTEARHLVDLCEHAAAWFAKQAQSHAGPDPSAAFFCDLTFRTSTSRWWDEGRRWATLASGSSTPPSLDALRAGYVDLVNTFAVEITSFERKQYANLSHAPNKAMNVNTYLGLLGGAYREDERDGRVVLSSCPPSEADLIVPDAEFVLILDADTVIAPDYTSKLLRHFGGPGGESLAIVQSPYSTFPGHHGPLQRIAGAQTDIQYILHQGFTHYDATYWVGANALVRVAALRELAVTEVERGYAVLKFISDRTLIEDTETSIDLARRGWRLYSHLERLAFSMTPSDFGALLIQRQRWANGGLLIVPKLFRYLRQRHPGAARLKEGFMRLHYLIALGPVSMALLIALGVAWDERLRAGSLLATGLIYYGIYARDLHLLGYRWYDVLRVVALNITLIPVNLAGMMSSVFQGVTGRKARFRRTPKARGRTRVPAFFVLAELALLTAWFGNSLRSLVAGNVVATAFMLVHALLAAYAIGRFIGFRDGADDVRAGFRSDGGQNPEIV